MNFCIKLQLFLLNLSFNLILVQVARHYFGVIHDSALLTCMSATLGLIKIRISMI